MASLQLFGLHLPANFRVTKIKIAAALAGIKIGDLSNDLPADQVDAFSLNCHPMGKFPALQTEQGYIFESAAILRHIARLGRGAGLYGATDFEASSIDSWLDFATTEMDPPALGMLLGQIVAPLKPEQVENFTKLFIATVEALERWLEVRTYLVGERPTIADVAVFVSIDTFLRYAPTANDVYKFKNVIRHYMTVLHHPKVQEGLKALGHEGTIPAKPKVEAPKKEEAKKEAKPAAAAAHADEEPEETFEEKKKPNPLDSLPPSKFVLDNFKREYSNADTRKVAAPYFFDNYDPEGFTCFWSNYKYNEENKMQFMTANLVRGWFQRMDHVRKYGFGCVLIAGEDKKHEITGFWVFRGKGLPQIVTEVDDTELFNWTEITDVQAEREKITDYFAWDGKTFEKNPVLEGRVFK